MGSFTCMNCNGSGKIKDPNHDPNEETKGEGGVTIKTLKLINCEKCSGNGKANCEKCDGKGHT